MITIARNQLFNDDWIVAIQDEIAAQPETLSDVVDPELMGRFDAEMGQPCESLKFDAEMGQPCESLKFYAKLGEIEAYIIGWKDAMAILEEARDYEEDMLDREDWARGQW